MTFGTTLVHSEFMFLAFFFKRRFPAARMARQRRNEGRYDECRLLHEDKIYVIWFRCAYTSRFAFTLKLFAFCPEIIT